MAWRRPCLKLHKAGEGVLPDNPEELTTEGEGQSQASNGEGGKKIQEDPGKAEWNPEVS